jgi:CRISPR-associated protein Csx17
MRALHAQGVDAGFAGWQEFRFKMKVSRVPWVTTGRYVEAIFRQDVTRLNKALAPLDESCFLDQFEIAWKGSKADSRSPHPVRTEINAAMETSAQEPTPHNCLDLLNAVFRACRQMATSESFRDKLPGKRATFFAPLPMAEWDGLLEGLDQAEFRIAQALASIAGLLKQMEGGYSETQPMLGSLLPLKLGRSEWYWPGKGDRSNQSVWSGSDLCSDLSEVLRRRYVDSLGDDQPALRAARGAPLRDILAFLRGDLDDHLIACWVEALSLIGWKIGRDEMPPDDDEHEIESIPPAYAALRSLLELECEWQGSDPSKWKKRRSHQPIAQLCQRSATSLPLAVNDSLRWIGIWGVANPWGTKARAEKPRLSGRDIVRLENVGLTFAHNQQQLVTRLPAAVCIPLEWRDRWKLFRAVSLPQTP